MMMYLFVQTSDTILYKLRTYWHNDFNLIESSIELETAQCDKG